MAGKLFGSLSLKSKVITSVAFSLILIWFYLGVNLYQHFTLQGWPRMKQLLWIWPLIQVFLKQKKEWA